jgi:hypothetical protein
MFLYGKINSGDLSFSLFAFPRGAGRGIFEAHLFFSKEKISEMSTLSAIAFFIALSSKSVKFFN